MFPAIVNPGHSNHGLEYTYRIGFGCPSKRLHFFVCPLGCLVPIPKVGIFWTGPIKFDAIPTRNHTQ